ncbi:LysR family transcriptional regulator [Sphingomonas aracearum]|uniref:LysR family transcriptional regulator n=1 Tax=Sphingomonas aracearum TaxID=2283317 RepID=A0A369VQF8_9SPHN|nr:LysR family transcriptional regulator [Sphingomonas aracearum]RDE04624.1 LysR family transcriptional regulator [Sphingomonas aracearum]
MLDPDYALFAAVASAGSLSAAGRQLGISPAMVSRRLARLEARLGVRLVHRTTRRLSLTAVGAEFHRDMTDILARLSAAEERVTGTADAPRGPLRVSAPTSFGRLHIAPHLPRFLDRWPAVQLQLDLSDGYVDLLDGGVDIAVRIAAELPAGTTAHRLATNRRVLTASPRYLAEHGAPPGVEALRDHHLLAASGQLPWHLVAERRRRIVEGRSRVRTNSSELVRELAIGGGGIALRSLWDVSEALGDGRLVRVLPEWEGVRDLGIHAVHLDGAAPSPAVRAFVDFLQSLFSPLPWREEG